jgi:hypothetical protein
MAGSLQITCLVTPHCLMNVQARRGSAVAHAYGSALGRNVGTPLEGPASANDLRYRGGKTIASLVYRTLYVGGDTSWNANDVRSIDTTLAAAMTDPGLNGIVQQYFDDPVSASFAGSEILDGPRPRLVTQSSIEREVRRLHHQGRLAALDLTRTVLAFVLPSGTILGDDHAPCAAWPEQGCGAPFEDDTTSLAGLGGYHGSVRLRAASGPGTVYYAVGVYSEIRGGRENGIPVFVESWKNVVATLYHQLCEVRTDPDVEAVIRGELPLSALGWVSDQGLECGDFPVSEGGGELRRVFVELDVDRVAVPVQLQYSNKAHGPERP